MFQMNQLAVFLFRSCMLCLVVTMMTGCQLMPHSLQPNQLRKLNRGRALGRDNYNFSIKDPAIPPREFSLDKPKNTD